MLSKLSVNNFALIENAEIKFQNGFTVITGETGSGKSILLGALQLILGHRADSSVIRNSQQKTIVEAVFSLPDEKLKPQFQNADLDWDKETIIRREISPNGKSRAFINDTPIQLNLLKSITEQLIHIHSQHHTLHLKNKSFQLNILDVIGGNTELLKELNQTVKRKKTIQKEIEELTKEKAQLVLTLDFNRFQLEELNALQLDQHDYQEIQSEVNRAEQFEALQNAFGSIVNALENDNGILANLQQISNHNKLEDYKLNDITERINSTIIELKDISATAEDELSNMEHNQDNIFEKNILLDQYYAVLKKHQVQSQSELIALQKQLSTDVSNSTEIDETILQRTKLLKEITEEAERIAQIISTNRKNTSKPLAESIIHILDQLKMNGSKVQFRFSPVPLSENGIDDVELLFSPNKGLPPQAIDKSASGGELSRLMLAIQFLLSEKQTLPTVIFDEIDTGVSGEVAQKIGIHLKNMGRHMQLIAITHLPQVASKGEHHILVRKEESKHSTNTYLTSLSVEERILEIAKLMSGSTINEAALNNAKNLMYE